MWGGLGFAELDVGVWLRPVPRMLLGAGYRHGRRLHGLAVVVGKNGRPAFVVSLCGRAPQYVVGFSLSYLTVIQGQKGTHWVRVVAFGSVGVFWFF